MSNKNTNNPLNEKEVIKKGDTAEIPVITDEVLAKHNKKRNNNKIEAEVLTNQRRPEVAKPTIITETEKEESNMSTIILGIIVVLLVAGLVYMGYQMNKIESSDQAQMIKKIEELTEENETLKTSSSSETDLTRANKNLEEENRKLSSEKREQEKLIDDLKEQSKNTNDYSTENYDRLSTDLNNLRFENDNLRTENANLQTQLTEANNRLNNVPEVDTSNLESQISNLQVQLEQSNNLLNEKDAEIDRLRQQLDSLSYSNTETNP